MTRETHSHETGVIEQIPDALDGERLDRVVALITSESRTHAGELVDGGLVLVGGTVVTTRSRKVRAGDVVEVRYDPGARSAIPRADPGVAVPVVYADDDVVVVDKPPGLVVHPGAGNRDSTLVNGLLARYPQIASVGDPERPGIVHRLDKGTSGLLVVARSERAYDALVSQLSDRTASRGYVALVWGHVDPPHGVVDAPIARSDREPTKMAVSSHGREARTHYDRTATYDEPKPTSVLTCHLETGRTHQIRVHLAAIGHPVVGDDRYGGARGPIRVERPFLHAATLAFDHPGTGERVEFSAPLPDDLAAVLATLR
jgi:23S rRNA pseudouridine1911/1915/1917 synthase